MADLAELHQELAGLLGLALATVLLARRAAALADQESASNLVEALKRVENAGEQVQRQCQLLISRHAGLRGGRITATSRKVKAGIVSRCGESAPLREVLGLLTTALDGAQAAAAELAARNPPDNDGAVAAFAEFAISVWKSTPLPYLNAAPGQAGYRLSAPDSGAIAADQVPRPIPGRSN